MEEKRPQKNCTLFNGILMRKRMKWEECITITVFKKGDKTKELQRHKFSKLGHKTFP